MPLARLSQTYLTSRWRSLALYSQRSQACRSSRCLLKWTMSYVKVTKLFFFVTDATGEQARAVVKNPFGLNNLLFSASSIIHKSYRQVLNPVNNSQLLDKFRLVTFHIKATQRNYNIKTGLHQLRRNESSHDLDLQHVIMKTLLIKCTLFL